MKKRFNTSAGCLSWLMALSLVFTAVPAAPAFAEESLQTEEYSEEYIEDSSVFVITDFPKLAKDDEGKFIDADIQKEFGDLTTLYGTPLDLLGLPDDIQVVGYLESDGPDALQAPFELKDMVWKLKSDTNEVYSETTPAGEYKFIPDLEKYTEEQTEEGTALYDEIKLAENVKAPFIKVTITEETDLAETEALETEPLTIPDAVDDGTAGDGTWMDDGVVDDGSDWTDDGTAGDGTWMDDGVVDDGSDSAPEDDIFSDLDDSLIDADNGDVWFSDDPQDDGSTDYTAAGDSVGDVNVGINEQPIDENPALAQGPGPVVIDQADDSADDAPIDDGMDDTPVDDGIDDTPIDVIPIDDGADGDPSEQPQAQTVHVMITLTDVNGHTVTLPADPTNLDSAPVLTSGTVTELPGLSVPCNFNLTDVTVKAEDVQGTTTLSIAAIDEQGTPVIFDPMTVTFTSGVAANITFVSNDVDLNGENYVYQAALTVTNADHVPGDPATCTTPQVCTVCGEILAPANGHVYGDPATCLKEQTCTVCGAVLAEKTAHTPGSPATCTEPQICTVCSTILAPAKGHTAGDPATCTDPQTCTECGAVLAPALGHDYAPATCEEPKTCTRCNATKGKPLGHMLEDDWEVLSASTDTEHGSEIRYCQRDDCDYSEERALNIIAKPENNGISGITAGANYNLNTIISFTAYGAGMGNQDPINGDVRYVPLSWAVQSTPGAFKDNYSGGFSVTQSGTYTLTVTYQQQKYQGSWQSTNETDTKTITFTVGDVISATPTDGIRINPQTGDNTPILEFVAALVAAAALIAAMLFYKKRGRVTR